MSVFLFIAIWFFSHFQMKVLKTAFEELTTANSENAEKTKKMCTACTTVIDDHPDVPTFLGSSDVAEGILCLSLKFLVLVIIHYLFSVLRDSLYFSIVALVGLGKAFSSFAKHRAKDERERPNQIVENFMGITSRT